MSDYFSDRENGPRARTEQMISPTVWASLVGTVQALINSGVLGLRFPVKASTPGKYRKELSERLEDLKKRSI